MTFRIRPAVPADLTDIKLLLRESAEYLNAIDDPEPILDEEINRIEHLAFGNAAVCNILITEIDVGIVGHLSYSWGLSMEGVAPALFVGDLFVCDGYRGRGLGRSLMENVRDIAQARGASQICWTVWRKNLAARAFYDRLGARTYDDEVLMTWPASPNGVKSP